MQQVSSVKASSRLAHYSGGLWALCIMLRALCIAR